MTFPPFVEKKTLTLDTPLMNLFCPVISKHLTLSTFLMKQTQRMRIWPVEIHSSKMAKLFLQYGDDTEEPGENFLFILSLLLIHSADYCYQNCAYHCTIFKQNIVSPKELIQIIGTPSRRGHDISFPNWTILNYWMYLSYPKNWKQEICNRLFEGNNENNIKLYLSIDHSTVLFFYTNITIYCILILQYIVTVCSLTYHTQHHQTVS